MNPRAQRDLAAAQNHVYGISQKRYALYGSRRAIGPVIGNSFVIDELDILRTKKQQRRAVLPFGTPLRDKTTEWRFHEQFHRRSEVGGAEEIRRDFVRRP